MTFTLKLNINGVKVNHHVRYLGQRSFSSDTHRTNYSTRTTVNPVPCHGNYCALWLTRVLWSVVCTMLHLAVLLQLDGQTCNDSKYHASIAWQWAQLLQTRCHASVRLFVTGNFGPRHTLVYHTECSACWPNAVDLLHSGLHPAAASSGAQTCRHATSRTTVWPTPYGN